MAYGVLSHTFPAGDPDVERNLDAMVTTSADSTVCPPQAVHALSSDGTSDAEVRAQRLRLVTVFSLSLGLAGAVWGLGQALFFPAAGDNNATRFAVSMVQSIILAAGGAAGYYHCRLRRLGRAAYSNVAALGLSATINLAFIRNAEGAAVVSYAAAVGLATLVIQGRAWRWLGGGLLISALSGAVLHSVPLLPQFEIPAAMATLGLIFSVTAGLGVPMGLFWVFSRDLTTSHQQAWQLARQAAAAESQTHEHAQRLEQRTAQLQAKNLELNDFLYVVSHDLRAPLINLEGFSRALQDAMAALDEADTASLAAVWTERKEEIDESLDFIVRSVGKMDFLVQGLLELSRIDSRPQLAQPVDIEAQVGEIVDSLRYTIDTRGIDVRIDALPTVIGDPVRISQVFSNLIDNAIKYAKTEGPAAIHVGCVRDDGRTRFFVRDHGVGIRPEDHAKIFRLFSRVGSPTVPGDGMGLTMVKKIVEKSGGRIWVESALGRGSEFCFTLPDQEADEQWEDGRGSSAATHQDLAG